MVELAHDSVIKGTEILSLEEVRILIPYDPDLAHYNAAVIPVPGDPSASLMLAREVSIKDLQSGKPDKGNLVLYRYTPQEVEKVNEITISDPRISNWEDPRAFTDENGEVLIGLTATRAENNEPTAAFIRGRVTNNNFEIDYGSLTLCLGDIGKNATPISSNWAFFRRNGEGLRHSLEVVEIDRDGEGELNLADRLVKTIKFPRKSWCEWQIGTTAQFLPDGILPIHGVSRTADGRFVYSLGLTQFDEEFNPNKIADEPLFTRESFSNILPMGRELDSGKEVVYSCGYSFDGRDVGFAINIGDLMTLNANKKLSELQEILKNTGPILEAT